MTAKVLPADASSPEDDEGLIAVKALLVKWGLVNEVSEPTLTVLGGGVSNLVVKAESSSGTWIVKLPLAKLRVSDDWFADRSRVMRETSCLKIISKCVGEKYAPRVLYEDPSNFACALECAPEGTTTWKEELLSGKIDPLVTERVAYFLSKFHFVTRGDSSIEREFSNTSNFLELRIHPYLDEIATRHEGLKTKIDEITSGLTRIQVCLVHGDFSPKNILRLPDGRLWIIDAEVAHYGNPAFDVAFCLNHLIIKAFHMKSNAYLEEAKRFWSVYWSESGWSGQQDFTVRVLGALMLARIDGKSPIEYLDETNRARIRKLSYDYVENKIDDFHELLDRVSSEILGK